MKVDKDLLDNVKDHMTNILGEYTDPLTGEPNTSAVAEDAARRFNLYDDNGYPQDWLFDLAFYVYRDNWP